MKLAFQIAFRFLISAKAQTFFIILGIGIGVSVQIFIGSLIDGLQTSLVDKTIGNSSQITISADEKDYIEGKDELLERIDEADERIKTVAPIFDTPVFYENEEETVSLLLRGMDLEKSEGIYQFSKRVIKGGLPSEENEILLGTAIGEEYGVKVGDEIEIVLPSTEKTTLKVTGFFDFQVASINESWAIGKINDVNKLVDEEGKWTSIETQVDKSAVFDADLIKTNVIANIGDDYEVKDWKEANTSLLSGLNGQSISSLMIQIFVLVSVVLGISSVLAISVMQKSKQVGILKAMGLKNSIASLIFLFEGLMLGILGAIFGLLFGMGLLYSFTTFAVNPDNTPVVPILIDPVFLGYSALIAIGACMIAAFIPAAKSSSLNPIDIIKNN